MMDLDRVNAYMARVEESETKTFKPVSNKLKVGLDLGTAYIVMVVLDEEDNPIACEKQAAQVLRDGMAMAQLTSSMSSRSSSFALSSLTIRSAPE